jgi:hypothetical protein
MSILCGSSIVDALKKKVIPLVDSVVLECIAEAMLNAITGGVEWKLTIRGDHYVVAVVLPCSQRVSARQLVAGPSATTRAATGWVQNDPFVMCTKVDRAEGTPAAPAKGAKRQRM